MISLRQRRIAHCVLMEHYICIVGYHEFTAYLQDDYTTDVALSYNFRLSSHSLPFSALTSFTRSSIGEQTINMKIKAMSTDISQ